MPAYDYACSRCGPFTEQRPMAEYQEPQACPNCGETAPRVLARAPGIAAMDGARRLARATNERSAHAPRRSAGGHGAGCAHCAGAGRAPETKAFPSARPWMISH
jgi:putative FmdB family regulatory protein